MSETLFFNAAFAQKCIDARRAFESGIELEVKVGGIAQPQRPSDRAADKAARAAKALDRLGGPRAPAQMGKENASVPQIIGHPYARQADAAPARVAQIAHE